MIGNDKPLALFAGPCVHESKETTMTIGSRLSTIAASQGVPFIFKASFEKANRTSVSSFRCLADDSPYAFRSLVQTFAELKNAHPGMQALTDVHSEEQADWISDSTPLDFVMIPALLGRQTPLLKAAARCGKTVVIKKPPYMNPADILYIIEKLKKFGGVDLGDRIVLVERGTCFGYNDIVVDFRGIEIMKSFGYPVLFDAGHSVQAPSKLGGVSGGNMAFSLPLAKAAVAMGIAGLYLEVHSNPSSALSDRHNQLPLGELPSYLAPLIQIDRAVKL